MFFLFVFVFLSQVIFQILSDIYCMSFFSFPPLFFISEDGVREGQITDCHVLFINVSS